MSFWRHEEIYRSDVGLGKAGNETSACPPAQKKLSPTQTRQIVRPHQPQNAFVIHAPALAQQFGMHTTIAIGRPSVARFVGSGCANSCRLLAVALVVGNGSIRPDSLPLPGRARSRLPPLRPLPGLADRAGVAIGDDSQGLLPETPQRVF